MAALTPSAAPPEAATGSPGKASGMDAPDWPDLTALRDAMNLAHETVLVARRAPADQVAMRRARVAELLAMSQYEQALTRCRLPIPSRLRQDARLLRRLLHSGSTRRRGV